MICNPPFGKNTSLAIRFFNHAATFASRIAFIVPLTFKKKSVQDRLDTAFHLEAQIVLPPDSFLLEGKPCDVPTTWQVWVRRDQPRSTVRSAISCDDFAFCKPEEADFAIQRIGANAGRIKLDVANSNSNSYTFLRATGMSAQDLLARFQCIDFEDVRTATAGNPSIAKGEMVALYSDLFAPVAPEACNRLQAADGLISRNTQLASDLRAKAHGETIPNRIKVLVSKAPVSSARFRRRAAEAGPPHRVETYGQRGDPLSPLIEISMSLPPNGPQNRSRLYCPRPQA